MKDIKTDMDKVHLDDSSRFIAYLHFMERENDKM